MRKIALASLAALALAYPVFAQDEASPEPAPGPADIVNAAPQEDWVVIAPEDMLVMTLAPDSEGQERKVVMQLMPAPFSQGWVENIRTLARAKWYDGISVNRVQDNYVVQWGDPGHDNPEGEGIATKPLPEGLNVMGEDKYENQIETICVGMPLDGCTDQPDLLNNGLRREDAYADIASFLAGYPVAASLPFWNSDRAADDESSSTYWPIHCYGMVGVGRNYSPDTGSGAELYTVIGHAPRHLDRNIALVGRIIGGMEHLSSLPRGSGALGFYTAEEAEKRTPILSIRVASDLPEEERPLYEYLNTETETFARYAEARANRRDPFFIVPAGGADICNIPVPVRAFEYND